MTVLSWQYPGKYKHFYLHASILILHNTKGTLQINLHKYQSHIHNTISINKGKRGMNPTKPYVMVRMTINNDSEEKFSEITSTQSASVND